MRTRLWNDDVKEEEEEANKRKRTDVERFGSFIYFLLHFSMFES